MVTIRYDKPKYLRVADMQESLLGYNGPRPHLPGKGYVLLYHIVTVESAADAWAGRQ